MYKAEWLYTVAVKCCTTVVQRRSGECEGTENTIGTIDPGVEFQRCSLRLVRASESASPRVFSRTDVWVNSVRAWVSVCVCVCVCVHVCVCACVCVCVCV